MGGSRPDERARGDGRKSEESTRRGRERSESERDQPAIRRISLAADAAVREHELYNAHNFYGDLKDIEAATIPDVQSFFKTFYAPNNAALAIVGDFETAEAKQWVENISERLRHRNCPTAGFDRAEAGKRKARNRGRSVGEAPGNGNRVSHAGAQYAGILRDGADRSDSGRGDDSALYQELVQKRA